MPILRTFRKILGGGRGETSRDDLIGRVVEEILTFKTFGVRGVEIFPASLGIRVNVRAPELTRAFVEDPSFDREIEASLLNRMATPNREALPLRRYIVERAEDDSVVVEELRASDAALLRVDGGDLDGARIPLPSSARELRLGRGPWHGPDARIRNDLVITESLPWISRAAAVLHRSGPTLEIESRDQGECLAVLRPDGRRVRPHMTASGRQALRPGDAIELSDGAASSLRLWLEA